MYAFIEGEGYLDLAQQLINIVYRSVAVQGLLPDHMPVSKWCHELETETRKKLVAQLNDIIMEVNTIGMTTDIWAEDYHQLSYMPNNCHFVTGAFKLIKKQQTDNKCVPTGGGK